MNISQFNIGNRTLSEILEDETGRKNYKNFTGFRFHGLDLRFASYMNIYHPFRINTHINDYYVNQYTDEGGYINKNYIHKGGAPLLNNHTDFSSENTTSRIVYYYNTPESMSPYDKGELLMKYENGTEYIARESCPSSIVIAVIGAGGGGAGGSGYIQKKKSYGGGSGAIVVANIQFPYNTNYSGPVFMISVGMGGTGGSPRTKGNDGQTTSLYMYSSNAWVKMFDIPGAKGGEFLDVDVIYSPSSELALTRANILYEEFTASTGAKFCINTSCRNFNWGSGTFNYIPGDYYNPGLDDNYWQSDYSSPQIVSSYLDDDGKIISMHRTPSSVYVNNNGNRAYYGRYSRFGASITPPYNYSTSTGTTGVGAGGSGGQSSTNIFDANLSRGADGGSGGIRIYW